MTKTLKYLFIFLLTTSAYSYEFKHFKLKSKVKSQALSFEAMTAESFNSNGDITAEIENTLNSDYQNIGTALSQNSLASFNMGGGVKNYNGFTWNKPFLNFTMNINREIAPHLFSKKWVVRDTLTLNINAKTLLSNMKTDGLIEITEDTIAAFAGIVFTRTYESASLVANYQSGISKDFNNLFFAFRNFKVANVLNLSDGEYIKRVDTITASVGGVLNVPVTTGLNLNVAALAKYTFINLVSAHAKDQAIKISSQKESALKIGAKAELQLDFFNLLKISLLSYELTYEVKKSKKITLEIRDQEKASFLSSVELKTELQDILNGKSHEQLYVTKPYIKVFENRSSKDLSSNYEVFLYGKEKSRKTEAYTIINQGVEKQFYSHSDSSKRTLQTVFSKLFSKLLGVTATTSEVSKNLNLEYVKELKNDDVKSAESFSFNINNSFYAKSLKKRRNRRRAVNFISYWSGFGSEVKEAIKNKIISKNIRVQSKLSFGKNALGSFLQKSKSQMNKAITKFCDNKSKERRCNKSLSKKYNALLAYNTQNTTINMELFRKFLSSVYNYSYKAEDFHHFFGQEGIHITAKITAKTSSNLPFTSYYSSGQLESTGVISSFASM